MIAAVPDVGLILVQLGGVFLALAVLGRLASRINLPSIPLYLLAGVLAGPDGPIPLQASEEFISVGAEIGVVLLLLLLGLEYSPTELRTGLRTNWRAGLVDLAANMPPGIIVGLALGWDPVAAVLLGGATYISSSGIIARLLSDLERIGNRETPVILSILVIEDLAMAIFLPIVAVLLIGGTFAEGAIAVAVALAAVAIALVASARWGHHASRLIHSGSNELLLLTLLGLGLLVAGVAERLQVSAAVGAFLLGVSISGQVAERGRELLMPLRDLFGGLFFVFFGLQVDQSELGPVILPAALLAVVTSGTKLLTGWHAARSAGIGSRGRGRAAISLLPRGEFSIVIAGLGVAAGIEEDLGSLTACYVLIMAFAGSIAMRYADELTPRQRPRGQPLPRT